MSFLLCYCLLLCYHHVFDVLFVLFFLMLVVVVVVLLLLVYIVVFLHCHCCHYCHHCWTWSQFYLGLLLTVFMWKGLHYKSPLKVHWNFPANYKILVVKTFCLFLQKWFWAGSVIQLIELVNCAHFAKISLMYNTGWACFHDWNIE